jgi:two-component system sensor histidine kinase SenX3
VIVPVVLLGVLASIASGVAVVMALRARRARQELSDAVGRLTPMVGGPSTGDQGLVDAVDRVLEWHDRAGVEAKQLAQALSAIPQGVVLADPAGRIVFRNAVAEIFQDARHSEALVEAAIDDLIADAIDGAFDSRTLDLFGPPRRTVRITALPVGGTGEASGVMVIIDDISERQRLDAVRRDFVANISHELRTPVGALGLLAEALLGEDDTAVRDRLAHRMLTETDRVAHTIEDLLTLSRIESEELPEHEAVPAGLVIAEAVDRIRPAAEQRDIALRVDEPDRRLSLLGDRRQLVSALYNLLDNAVKYSETGSDVEVSARTDGELVDLVVRDHGVGIRDADRERIFERFYRVDPGRSRQTGGTGLGLAIVRHVATNHGGEVLVDSALGEGSTFVLRIPTATTGPIALTRSEAS